MTQKDLIIAYVEMYGSILPAKMSGKVFGGVMFGSETSKRCRELRSIGKLVSHGEGKFEVFEKPDKLIKFAEEALNGRRVIERNGVRYYLPK